MPSKKLALTIKGIDHLIREIRGQKIILDADLARLYGVTTKRLNEQVKRNRERFPEDFMFQLTAKESAVLRSQIATTASQAVEQEARGTNWSQFATSSRKHRGATYRAYAFTEHGAIMAANVLNSTHAVQISVFVVRAFLKMRSLMGDKRELAQQLAALEKELKQRLDIHEAAIVTILQRVMDIIDPPNAPVEPQKPRIGFTP